MKLWRIKPSTLAALSLCIMLTACGESREGSAPLSGLTPGDLAPDFTLTDLEGKAYTLSSFRNNNPVLLVFWATWCPYCITEIPRLSSIHETFSGKGLKVLAVNVASNDPLARVEAFSKKRSIPYTILYDKDIIASRLYAVQGIPVSVVIDRSGTVRYRGNQLPGNIEQLLTKIL